MDYNQRNIQSMPRLPQKHGRQLIKRYNSDVTNNNHIDYKPERPSLPKPNKKGTILSVLRNWRDQVIERHFDRGNSGQVNSKADSGIEISMPPTLESFEPGGYSDSCLPPASLPPQFAPRLVNGSKRVNRREPRRHTVSHGIDYNQVRSMTAVWLI